MMEPLLEGSQQAEDDWLFSQINQLFKRVNESNIQIENEDLVQFSVSETNCYKILKEIQIHLQTPYKTYYHSVFSLLYKRILIIIYYGTIINLCQLIILVLLDLITNILKETNINKYLLLTYFLSMMVASILKTYVQSKECRQNNLFLLRIRILINHLVFTKALRIQNMSAQFNKGTKQTENIVNANTLITTDIEEIMYVQYCIKDVWTGIILITGSMFILAQKDLYSTMIVIGALFISLILNGIIVYYNICADEQMMNYKDKRVELTTNVLGCMKQIKQLVWEENFSNKILEIRKIEFKYIALLKILDGFSRAFWINISNFLLFIFVSISLNNQKSLIDLNVFTLIAIFNTLKFPLGIFPWCVNCGVCFKVSFERICKYLEYQEINQNDRIILPTLRDSNQMIICKDMVFSWPKYTIEPENFVKTQVQIADQPEQQFNLRIEDLSIQQNTLNFVIGQIGSGKSAFFNAILNEMSSNQRHVKQERQNSFTSAESLLSTDERIIIKGSIAYCSQNTWVQNDTIQANILFGKQFESNLYNQVIDVCQIYTDLIQFEKRDLHEIGPEGKNLSGGQKQRITLARALYQDADIYLLDDIFSSLDVHVADEVFEKAIIQFLIGKGKTVLLITSHYRYMRQVPSHVNQKIVYLNNGILEHNQEIIKQFIQIQTQQEYDNQEQSDISKNKELESKDSLSKIQSDMEKDDNESDNLEERLYDKFNTQVLRYYLNSMGFFLVFLTLMSLIAMQSSLSLLDFWLREELTSQEGWLHEITIYFNNSFGESFTFLTLLSISITLIKSAICVAWSLKAAKCIFDKLNSILMASNCAFYDKNNIGRIINRVQGDTKNVDDELPYFYTEFIDNLTKALTLSIALMILFPYFILVFIIVIFCYYSISQFYAKSNREIKRLQKANQGNLLQILNETLTGITVIRAFDKQQYFEDTFYKKLFKQIVSFQCGERSSYWLDVRLNLMSNLIIVCVTSIIYLSVLADLDINYNTYAMALTYSVLILESCFNISYQYLELEQQLVSVERIQQYHQNPMEQIDSKQIINKKQPIESDVSVKFIDVSLSYDGKSALKDFTLSIKQGEKVAFVGRTGSGKTSILNVLFGLYQHQFGSIEINGNNTKHMSLRELRKEMSVVPQFGFLYNATVKDNLDPLGNVSKEEIENLFRETGFNLRGIADLYSGCNTDFMIQQNGANLSNGEKQVLNFMRIMLLNKSIVCLDEATSNMDPKTDQLLHDLLFKYVLNRTLLVITHRLENIAIYDRIVVMEQGQIVECGSYNQLLKKEGGFLQRLVQNHQK